MAYYYNAAVKTYLGKGADAKAPFNMVRVGFADERANSTVETLNKIALWATKKAARETLQAWGLKGYNIEWIQTRFQRFACVVDHWGQALPRDFENRLANQLFGFIYNDML